MHAIRYRALSALLMLLAMSGGLSSLAADKAVVVPGFGDDFLVIPLPSGVDCPGLDNSITVEKSGGDFSDPRAAIDSITDAAANKVYSICIGPGTYNLSRTLKMKPYVDIIGSGEGATILKGPGSSSGLASSAVVAGADNAALSMLSIRATGGLASSVGIYNSGASPDIFDVTVYSDGKDINYGVYNTSSSPSMTDMTITATGGDIHYAVYNKGSSPSMTNVTAVATGGDINHAVFNTDSEPMIHQSTLDGSSKDGDGLISKNDSTATVSESIIKGEIVAKDSSSNICTDTVNGGGVMLEMDCTLP